MDPPMDPLALQEKAGQASRLLKSLANERRLLIMCHLSQGEKSVGELEPLVGLSQSALSWSKRDGMPRRSSTRSRAKKPKLSWALSMISTVPMQTPSGRAGRPATRE
jgi:DNA-binding HxlR family transcriptional regulator